MNPMGSGDIRERPWHVPYNSDKKTFQGLTGRDSLEGEFAFLFGNVVCADVDGDSVLLSVQVAGSG